MVIYNIEPVFDENSEILILGSFPSVKSRETEFFYGNGQNRFWKVIASVFGDAVPETVEEKKNILLKNRVALWDVISECEISNSSDSTIKNARANDIGIILDRAKIKGIFVNGRTAEKYYNKFLFPKTKINAICLPSTSPANAAKSVDALIEIWKKEILCVINNEGAV